MKNLFYGLIVAFSMAFMLPAYADVSAGLNSQPMTSQTVLAFGWPDHPVPAAHIADAVGMKQVVRPYSVSYIAVGTASTAVACAGEDNHYKSIVAGRPSKIPIAI